MATFRFPLPPQPAPRDITNVIRGELYTHAVQVDGILNTDIILQGELLLKPTALTVDTDPTNVRIRISPTLSDSGGIDVTGQAGGSVLMTFLMRPPVTLRAVTPGATAVRIWVSRGGKTYEQTVEAGNYSASTVAITTDPQVVNVLAPSFVTLTSPVTDTSVDGFAVAATAYEDDDVTVLVDSPFTFATSDPDIAIADSNGVIHFGTSPFGGIVRITATDSIAGLTASVNINVIGSWRKLIDDLGGDPACIAAYFPDPSSVIKTSAGLITQINDVRGDGFGPPLISRLAGHASIVNHAFHFPNNAQVDSGVVDAVDSLQFTPLTVAVCSTINQDGYGAGIRGGTGVGNQPMAIIQHGFDSNGSDPHLWFRMGGITQAHPSAIRPTRPSTLTGPTRPDMVATTISGAGESLSHLKVHASGVTYDAGANIGAYYNSGNVIYMNWVADSAPGFAPPLEESFAAFMIFFGQFSEQQNRIFDIWAAKYSQAVYSLDSGAASSNIGYDGNSIMLGYPSYEGQGVMEQVNVRILAIQGESGPQGTVPSGWTTDDVSIVGYTADNQSTELNLLPLINNFNLSSIAVVMEGTNGLQYLSAAACENYFATTCKAYWDAGYKPIIMTVIKAGAGARSAGFDARRLACNALIMSDWAQYAFAVYDAASEPLLQDPADGVYFHGDQLHLDLPGLVVLGTGLAPIIEAVRAMVWHERV